MDVKSLKDMSLLNDEVTYSKDGSEITEILYSNKKLLASAGLTYCCPSVDAEYLTDN